MKSRYLNNKLMPSFLLTPKDLPDDEAGEENLMKVMISVVMMITQMMNSNDVICLNVKVKFCKIIFE